MVVDEPRTEGYVPYQGPDICPVTRRPSRVFAPGLTDYGYLRRPLLLVAEPVLELAACDVLISLLMGDLTPDVAHRSQDLFRSEMNFLECGGLGLLVFVSTAMLNGRFQSPYESVVEACPFRVPSAVKRAVLLFLCKHVNGRAISTTQLVKEVRSNVPDCKLTDDQMEEYAVRTAIREEFAIKFDRKMAGSEPWDAFLMPK